MNKALVNNSTDNPGFYTFLSSITAAVGLATNSPATIIGSMLLSPIGDIIVRLSIIGAYNLKNQDVRSIYRENYFQKYGIIPSSVTIKNGNILINNSILKAIIKIEEDYYLYFEDNKFMELYTPRNQPSQYNVNVDNEKFNKFIDEQNTVHDYQWWEYLWVIREKDQYTDIKGYIVDDKDETINKKVQIISSEKILQDLRRAEKQEILPWNNITYLGKKYKFQDILMWGVFCSFLAIFIGWFCGIVFKLAQMNQRKNEKKESFPIPTKEMSDRAQIENAIGMIFIALASGIILPEAVKNENSIRLVGIGIATALLPPLVNIGLYLGILTVKRSLDNPKEIEMDEEEIFQAVYTGILVFIINFGILLGVSMIRVYSTI